MKGRRSRLIPIGDEFLRDYKMEDLQKMQKEETNQKAKIRLLVYIQRKKRMAISEIAETFNMAVRTTQEWLRKAAKIGGITYKSSKVTVYV